MEGLFRNTQLMNLELPQNDILMEINTNACYLLCTNKNASSC